MISSSSLSYLPSVEDEHEDDDENDFKEEFFMPRCGALVST